MYDLIIVGGGPAGLTAAVYAIRKRLNVLLLTKDLGGKTNYHLSLPWMEDYQTIRGLEIVNKFRNELDYLDFARRIDTAEKITGREGYYSFNTRMEKPDKKIHFSGNVYVLTNERSYSASTLFAALVHKYKRGTIIGRETGTCYYQMNAYKSADIRLDNSGLELHIPLTKIIFDDQPDPSIPWGHGVIPDHIIGWTYDEYLNNSDPILVYTLKLIRESK